jgi:hypothetical protein
MRLEFLRLFLEHRRKWEVKRVRKAVLVLTVALMAAGMLTLSVSSAFAKKPTTMTLSGYMIVLGPGTGSIFPAGESGNVQTKFRDVPFVLEGDIIAGEVIDPTTWTAGGLYHGNLLEKPSGGITWHGTWTMEVATIAGIGSGSLKFESSWDEGDPAAKWWVTGATGGLSGLKGEGSAWLIIDPFLYGYEFEAQIP